MPLAIPVTSEELGFPPQ